MVELTGPTDTPGFVLRDHLSRTLVTQGLKQPTREQYEQHCSSLSGLAPSEVYLAKAITCPAGGLLHHRFSLTDCSAVYSLLHFLAGYPEWALPTALLCGARTFLVSLSCRDHVVDPVSYITIL